jgi:IS30 family transposase
MGRSPSSLSRELKRNGKRVGRSRKPFYEGFKAQKKSSHRFKTSHQRACLKIPQIHEYVTSKLLARWSPELIAGRLALDHPELKISHETIYQWIYNHGRDYIRYLARRRRIRRPRTYSLKTRGSNPIPARVMIDSRPEMINSRQEPGHWEVDLVESYLKRGGIQVISERKTRFSLLTKMQTLKGVEARTNLIQRMKRLPSAIVKTLTYDNGPENMYHVFVNRHLGTRSYFCHPYHGWEKGTVENTIGIVRRFYPKGTDFRGVSEKEIKKLEAWLNNRPRKCLAFKTPSEAFKLECCT